MSAPLILRADEGAVAVVILNDPAKLNALSTPMLNALATEFDALAADPAVRVVVIRAIGKAFCAGHDLKEIQAARLAHDGGAAAFGDLFSLCSRIMQQIASLPKPVIAEVQGIACSVPPPSSPCRAKSPKAQPLSWPRPESSSPPRAPKRLALSTALPRLRICRRKP